jgi:ribosome recycling factor
MNMDTEIKQKLKEVKDWLQQEFANIRTGQASPALLDFVKVESYGTLMPLNQISTVGVEDARTLRVSVWDASVVKAAEEAIRDAELGVSVVGDSTGLRVIFPELTSERREQLLKLAKSKLEDARIAVRAIRDDFMKVIEKSEKAGDIGEDEKFTKKEAVQSAVDEINRSLESLCNQKESELKA